MSANHTPNTLPLPAQIEALLFAAPAPLTASQLARTLDVPTREIEQGLAELEASYALRGIRLQRHRGQYQLTSAPEAATLIERLLGLEGGSRLSRAALECLAIIAYKQPITRPQIDSIRGVSSEGVLRNLLRSGLVQEIGRAEGPGHPILYSTTAEFLQHFGLTSLEELPPLEETEND